MTIKGVVFDLDGTIVAFNLDFKMLRADVRGYLLKNGVPASVITVNENIFEMLKKTEIFFKNQGKSSNAIQRISKEALSLAEKYELDAATRTSMLPGAFDTLKVLKQMGLKIGLFTISSEKAMDYLLKRFNLTDVFNATVPREKVNYVKPHPEHLETVLKVLGISAAETVVIGDSISDMQGAKEHQAIAVGLPTGVSTVEQLTQHGAHYIISSITDLPILIGKLNKTQEKPF
jgi:HAD superfamily hydrolase (TIGR01549 family)